MNVLLLVLDGLSPRHVRPDVMPTLAAMGGAGGWNRLGGLAVMPASIYPNHATLATRHARRTGETTPPPATAWAGAITRLLELPPGAVT